MLPGATYQEVPSTRSWTDVVVGSGQSLANHKSFAASAVSFAWGAAAGGSGLDETLVGDIAISVIPGIGVYADIRDLAIEVLRFLGKGSDRFDSIAFSIAALGVFTEVTPHLDLVTDAVRGAYRAMRSIRHTATGAQVYLAVHPFIGDFLVEFFKKIPFYVANGFPSATGSGEGTPSLRLGSLIAEGEPPAALLRDFATFVQRLSTGPAGHRFSLLIKAMNEGSDAFTRALADLQSQLGARNKELIGAILDGMRNSEDFVQLITKLADDAAVTAPLVGKEAEEVLRESVLLLTGSIRKSAAAADAYAFHFSNGRVNDIAAIVSSAVNGMLRVQVSTADSTLLLGNLMEKIGKSHLLRVRRAFDNMSSLYDQVMTSSLSTAAKEESVNGIRSWVSHTRSAAIQPFLFGRIYQVDVGANANLTKKQWEHPAPIPYPSGRKLFIDVFGERNGLNVAIDAKMLPDPPVRRASESFEAFENRVARYEHILEEFQEQFLQYAENSKKGVPGSTNLIDVVEYYVPDELRKEYVLRELAELTGQFGITLGADLKPILPPWLKVVVHAY